MVINSYSDLDQASDDETGRMTIKVVSVADSPMEGLIRRHCWFTSQHYPQNGSIYVCQLERTLNYYKLLCKRTPF